MKKSLNGTVRSKWCVAVRDIEKVAISLPILPKQYINMDTGDFNTFVEVEGDT